ncbi:MAG: ankyrin repeat domain-containing protein [Spirochaetaceae bacterium]|jgi:ankyrin repeat protein|nr:ankyrin repeat domain-containing protein [Spirochaetaceae bacterium]
MKGRQLLKKNYYLLSSLSAIFFILIIVSFFNNSADCFARGKDDARLEQSNSPSVQPAQSAQPNIEQKPSTAVGKLASLISSGRIEEAKTLFISDIKPGDVDREGRSALHYAAMFRRADLADFFIRLGSKVDMADNEQNTPLNISAGFLDSKTASILIMNGADIHHKSSTGESPAQAAIKSDNLLFLSSILTGDTLILADAAGKNILHIAAEADNVSAVDEIIRAARDARGGVLQTMVNKKDNLGKTPLDICFSHRDSTSAARISAVIISAGGVSSDPFYPYFSPAVRSLNYNIRPSNGISPIHFSVREHYSGWTDYLLSKNADPNIKNALGDTPLIEAARIGDIEAIRSLIGHGALVNIQDAQGNTAMHIAIPPEVHREILELLLNSHGDPNIRDIRGDSPAHIVIDLNRPANVLEVLLSYGADVSIHNIDGKTPLFVAVEKDRTSLIPLLLKHKSDIFAATNQGITVFEKALQSNNTALDEMITEETVQRSDNGGNTLLIAAVRLHANVDIARRILDKNANVNARNQEGDTALHIAVRQNEAALGELLISRGADIFLQNTRGESPLYLTFYSRGGVREWMFIPAVLTTKDGQGKTILHWAAEWKLDQVIPVIVTRGALVDAQNALGETPLFVAVRKNFPTTARALLQAGASLNGRDSLGNTVLHTAVRFEAQAAAEMLLNTKINVNAYNLNGNTPLHDAVRLGKYPFVSLFIQRGANIEIRDTEGNTALMTAIIVGNYRISDFIIRSGADVNTRNNEGNTPLMIVVLNERSDLVALLLDFQAQIHARNAEGDSPFTAALRVSPRMVLSLLAKGRDQTDEEGRSPLHIALLTNGNEDEIEAIVGWVGTKQLSVVDRQGRIPLRYAADEGNWLAAKFLTDQGSNVFSVARDGKTPADIVFVANNHDAIRALFGGKAISATDPSGNTALHYAAKLGSTDTITFLIELGAVKNVRNTSGETAADIALRWGNSDAAAVLK